LAIAFYFDKWTLQKELHQRVRSVNTTLANQHDMKFPSFTFEPPGFAKKPSNAVVNSQAADVLALPPLMVGARTQGGGKSQIKDTGFDQQAERGDFDSSMEFPELSPLVPQTGTTYAVNSVVKQEKEQRVTRLAAWTLQLVTRAANLRCSPWSRLETQAQKRLSISLKQTTYMSMEL